MSRWWNPRIAHYASIIVGFSYIVVISQQQWFFGDDWAIIAPHLDDTAMDPHVGHWNLVPALVFPVVRDLVGLGSYFPFLAFALIAHLAVVHLVWRLMNRAGVQPWISTSLAGVLLLLGGGAENILWAFQFGFLGAIAVGLATVLLLDREKPIIPLVIALAIVAPMFSGTAIPLLAAAGILGWIRRGFLRTAVLLLPAAAVYLAWYLLVARPFGVPAPGFAGPGDVGRAILYAAAMYAGGLGRALPFIGLGVIPAVAVVIWVIVTVRRGVRGMARQALAPALALVAGSLVFVALTTYSRLDNGLSSAASQRYAYLTITLLLPALGLILGWLAARSRRALWLCLGAVIALALYNAVTLAVEANSQAAREAGSRERVEESLEAVIADPGNESLLDAPADPQWAPDLLGSDLLLLHRNGQLN